MRIIDAYLVRQYVQTFLVCFISLTGLYIVIDAFGHLDELLAQADHQGGVLAVVGPYYAYRSLLFFDRTSGILALISGMFTVTWIQRHQEMTALLAAGISKGRVILPVIVCALAVSLVAASSREAVIPRIRQHLVTDTRTLSEDAGHAIHPRYDNRSGIFLNGAKVFPNQQRIEAPRFLLPAGLNQYGKSLAGGDAFYRPAEGKRPSGYLVTGVSQPETLDRRPSLQLAGRTVLFTPHDYPWLEADQCFVASDVAFDLLASGSSWQQYSSTAELIRALASPSLDFGAPVRVAVHTRLIQPLLDATLLLLGLPLVLSSRNRNAFVAIGLCLLVVIVFMIVALACQFLGASSLIRPPALAAWLPLMLFVPVAVYLSDPLRE